MVEIIALLVLFGIIIVLIIERQIYSKTMLKQLDDCLKAAMSRNLDEYRTATELPKKDTKFAEQDEVLLENVDDDMFNKFIEEQKK